MKIDSLLVPLFSGWAVITFLWVMLLIYRALLARKEEDQVFLHRGEEALLHEQQHIAHQMDAVGPYVKWIGIVSAILLLVVAALWIHQGLTTIN
ncbi:MAG: hypothetical protein LAO31_02915 [Acidobacteriia bacterium]|nr:hypothetical protein [Terriglobia bacterium]